MLIRNLFLILMSVAICGFATAYAIDTAGSADNEKDLISTRAQYEAKAENQYKGLDEIISSPDHLSAKRSYRTIFLDEDFQGATFPPASWDTTNYNPGWGWFLGTPAAPPSGPGGTQCALVTWDQAPPATLQDEWLFTPPMYVSSATSLLRLEFWFFKDNSHYEHEFKIYASTVGGTDHADYDSIWDSYDITHPNMTWYETSVDLSAYAGSDSVTLAFQYLGTDANLFGIDDIVVTDDSPPIGRCCYGDPFDPTCEDSITGDSCDCLGGYWVEGLNCTDDPCPPFGRHIEPSDDMYSDPDDGVGHSSPHPISELWTADYSGCQVHHERIMMRFDLGDFIEMEIDSAFLNIYRWFRCPNHYYTDCNFYYITQNWSEATWNEHLHIGHEVPSFLSYEFGPENDWHRIDIQSGVEGWLTGGVTNYGLVIQAKYNEKFSKFYSKEGPAGFRPYLEIYISEPPTCIPGDADGSGGVDIDDVVYLINYIFAGGPAPIPEICCGDANGNGVTGCGIDIDDVVYLIEYIFAGGPPPEDACTLCP